MIGSLIKRSRLFYCFAILVPLALLWLTPIGPSLSSRVLGSSDSLAEVRQQVKPELAQALKEAQLNLGDPVFIRIFKEERLLEVWVKAKDRYQLFRSYEICRYSGDLGPKIKEGDRQSPEGFYAVPPSAMNPNSSYHLSFNLGFPNSYDRAHARTGSYLMVHGSCVSIGCYAMTDAGIEEIYLMVDAAHQAGHAQVPVHIFPFRMTAERLSDEEGSEWFAFWTNLKTGYDLFETHLIPPGVSVSGKSYVFTHPVAG